MSYGELSNTQETMVLPMLQMKNIRGKPYITVSAKGMINGLSNIPNDGADFGPDTTLGATAPGQYGSPYTETSGIKEAIYTNYNHLPIVLGEGIFSVSAQLLSADIYVNHLVIRGQSTHKTVIQLTNINTLTVSDFPSNATGVADGYLMYPTFDNNINMSGLLFISDLTFDFNNQLTSDGYGIGGISPLAVGNYGTLSAEHLYRHLIFKNQIGGSHGAQAAITDQYVNGDYPTVKLNIEVSSCLFYTFTGDVLDVGNAQNINIFNNLAINTSSSGCFNLTGNASFVPTESSVKIHNNFIASTGTSGQYTQATSYGGNQPTLGFVEIYNNTALNISSFCNFAAPAASTVQSLLIHDNIFNSSLSGSFFFKEQSTITITSLVISPTNNIGYNPTPILSANPPVSGTVYQNTNPYDIEIDLPVYATTSGTAGYVTIAKGSTSTPTAVGNQFVNGSTSSTSVDIIRLRVPAGWYYEFTASGVTFGTASVFAD